MMKKARSSVMKMTKTAIEYVAVKKANANCLGLMYEPKRPENIVKK